MYDQIAADAVRQIREDHEHTEKLREALAGMVTLLETLRTVGNSRYCYVEARGGQMVHVADAIDSARALLGPNVGAKLPHAEQPAPKRGNACRVGST